MYSANSVQKIDAQYIFFCCKVQNILDIKQ